MKYIIIFFMLLGCGNRNEILKVNSFNKSILVDDVLYSYKYVKIGTSKIKTLYSPIIIRHKQQPKSTLFCESTGDGIKFLVKGMYYFDSGTFIFEDEQQNLRIVGSLKVGEVMDSVVVKKIIKEVVKGSGDSQENQTILATPKN